MIKLTDKNIEIYALTLLSSEEYNKYELFIPSLKDDWWLRDAAPGWLCNVYCINYVGNLIYYGCRNVDGVRPFCILETLNPIDITVGDKVEFGYYKWTVLDVDNNIIKMLCDEFVDSRIFDNNTNVWQKSELFDWLNTDFLPLLLEQAK